MTDERIEIPEDARASDKDDARTADLDRIDAKLERLSAQRKALRRAMGQFDDDFDPKAWKKAFDSPEPDDINRVFTVTGGYLALVNNTAEAIRAGVKLTGLKPAPGMSGVPAIIEAVRADGGFTRRQAETFTELYRTRNRLQHSSPDIQADEVHRQVRRLLQHLPRLVESYLEWLRKYDVEP
ncbi:MAG TPA: hypothetical protein VGX72_10025 [Solirubrobacteraceae bacterium]|nr:hypothetical protein [Solirubrobacteraceae bacterium]